MGLCGTNGSYDAFTDSCQNCRFAGAAHQAFQIRSYGYSCFYKKFNTILCHSRYIGGFDDLGIYAHFYSFQDVTALSLIHISFKDIDKDALITADKYEEIKKRFS